VSIKAYIDLGHDEGSDTGAVCGSFIERNMIKVYAAQLVRHLVAAGWDVKVKPPGLGINASAAVCNAFNPDIMFSCHINAGGGDRGEVIHSIRAGSKQLANVIGSGLSSAGQTKVNTYLKLNTNGTDYFGMLRQTKCAAVIIEPFFLDNIVDRQIGNTDGELQHIGKCIAFALLKHYGGLQIKEETEMVRYRTLNEIPNESGFRDVVDKLMNAKIITGDGSDTTGNTDVIDLSHDQVRTLVFTYRGGAFDKKLQVVGLAPAVK